MSAYSSSPLPTPALRAFLAASMPPSAAPVFSSSAATAEATRLAAMQIQGLADGAAQHKIEGGDNPPPESVIFALISTFVPELRAYWTTAAPPTAPSPTTSAATASAAASTGSVAEAMAKLAV